MNDAHTDQPPAAGDDAALPFEQAIEQLEEIIDQIESGEIGLEAALSRYERGSALIKHCRAILDSAEKRIAELTATEDGGLRVQDESDDEREADI